MDTCALVKSFYNAFWLQSYMYAFMYVDAETILQEDYFTDTKTFAEYYKKISTPGPLSKHWLGFIYICSENYELDLNIYGTGMKI